MMHTPRNITIVLLLAAFASVASAQEAKTRAQVKAELAMAIGDGDMIAVGESGLTEYQLEPQRYAHQRSIDAATKLTQHSAPQASGARAQ